MDFWNIWFFVLACALGEFALIVALEYLRDYLYRYFDRDMEEE